MSAPALDGDDTHHLDSALRLRPGEPVSVTDGRGGYRLCTYTGKGEIEPAGEAEVRPARFPLLTVAFAPVKGDRPDWAVQKLVELGVDRIVVLRAERSVVRWEGDRIAPHLERLRRVARSAVMQSRQVWLPEIAGVVPAFDLLGAPSAAAADRGGSPPWPGLDTVLVGPEGGWTEAERARAGSGVVGLGPTVLRAETAAVTAGALLCALREGLVAPVAGQRLPGAADA